MLFESASRFRFEVRLRFCQKQSYIKALRYTLFDLPDQTANLKKIIVHYIYSTKESAGFLSQSIESRVFFPPVVG